MYMQQTTKAEHRTAENKVPENKTGVPDHMKRQYEALSGLSMDDVRVHYNSAKPSQLDALAYTQGSHVYVAPGQERHLGHELGHVIQQKQGRVRATGSLGSVAVNLDEKLEREADAYDRRARTYGVISRYEGGVSDADSVGSVAQLRPVEDPKRKRPFYMDDKFDPSDKPRLLLKLFVEMGRYVVFQIRDHVRRIFWKKDQKWIKDNPKNYRESKSHLSELIPEREPDEDKYYTDSDFENEFNLAEFLEIQPLDAWMEAYEEANTAMAEIDASDLEESEKMRQKNALTRYILQRHIVNALYRAEELDRMDYSGSPLSYQNRSSYMRSGAGSFVDALKELLLKQKPMPKKAAVILTRSGGLRQELDKFFYYLRAKDSSGDLSEELNDAMIRDIIKFVEELSLSADTKSFQEQWEETAPPRIFVDTTGVLSFESLEQQEEILSRQKEIIFWQIARAMNLEEEGRRILFLSHIGKSADAKKKEEVIQRLRQEAQERQDFLAHYIAGVKLEQQSAVYAQKKQALDDRLKCAEAIQRTNEIHDINGHLATEYVKYVKSKSFTGRAQGLEILYQNIGALVTVGQMISLQAGGVQQSALLLADTKMDHEVKAAVNKAGYVPSITEAIQTMLQYNTDEGRLSLPQITELVFAQQKEKNWKRAGGNKTGNRAYTAMDAVKTRLNLPKTSQYKMQDRERARKLAQTCFLLFCQRLVDSPEMSAPKNRRIFVQASTVMKLINSCGLFTNDRIPAFVWYQLEYYLDAALHSENHLVDFTRNIQAIHEIILLGIELQGEEAAPRGEEFRLKAPEAEDSGENSRKKLYRGAYLADYGLKAFAQVYDAAIAQHAADTRSDPNPRAADVAAFYNIYFELTEKLKATAGANSERVHRQAPESVEEFVRTLNSGGETAESAQDRLPDIIMIDIHPNDATKAVINQNDVAGMLDAMNDYMMRNQCPKRITVIVDITLNQAADKEVAQIRKRAAVYLAQGWLNLVFVQSLTKFAQMGMDKHSGGLVFFYNDAEKWGAFNEDLSKSRDADPVDPYMQRYFQLLFDNAADEQREYIDIIRENTQYVQRELTAQLEGTAITISDNKDTGSCYVAWRYEKSYGDVVRLYNKYKLKEAPKEVLYSLHEFNIAILENGINTQMSKRKLPVAMRFSFGFPISNLGETGNEVRFTIGTETREELNEYIEVIGYIGEKVRELIDMEEGILRDGQLQGIIPSGTLFHLGSFKKYLESLDI